MEGLHGSRGWEVQHLKLLKYKYEYYPEYFFSAQCAQ